MNLPQLKASTTLRVVSVLAAVFVLSAQYGCEAPKKPAAPPASPAAAPATPSEAAPEAPAADKDASMKKPAGLPAPAGEEPAYGDWLVSRLPVEMKHLNPLNTSDAYSSRAINYVFDTLLYRDPLTLELKPNLAESWEAAPDHMSYSFKIRDGVNFHDGHPLSAEDVKFTFDKMMDPTTDCPDLRNYYNDIASCDLVDDHTVKFTCKKPFFLHEIMIGDLSIIPKHIYSVGDFNLHPNNRAPIGSGPYKLEKWETNQQLTFVRNTDYWGKALGREGHVDKFIWRIVTDDNAAMQLALRGELDSLSLLPKEWTVEAKLPEFENQFNKFAYDTPGFHFIGWNQRKPFFSDKRVRRAMTMFLDRESIRQNIYHGLAEELTGGFMPGTAEYDSALKPLPFDPAAASKLLDEAGWIDHNGNGTRDKDGVEFAFEFLLPTKTEEWEQIATILQEELKRAGITLTIRQLEWAQMVEMVDKRQFDCFVMGWSMTPDPDMYQIWHSSQIDKGSNYIGFNVSEADKIIEDFRASFDREERIKLCLRFHAILYEEQPYTFLFQPKGLMAVSKRVHNAVVYPLFRTRPVLEWYVPTALQKFKNQ